MPHLVCIKHDKRVFFNPESGSVLHRSEDVKCDSEPKWGNLSFDSKIYLKLRFCTYCRQPESELKEYDVPLCNSRVGNQPHIFLG